MGLWQQIVQMHVQAQWGLLVPFYGGVALVGYLVFAEVLRFRASSRAKKAQARVAELEEELGSLRGQQQELLNAIKEQEETNRKRTERLAKELSRQLSQKLDRAARDTEEDIDNFRHRLAEVEERIPSLHEHLDDLRVTLSGIFQSELGSVLSAFDNSVTSVLQHMRDQLQMGLCTIEGIESMVKGRRRAERHLLGPSAQAEVQPSAVENDAGFDLFPDSQPEESETGAAGPGAEEETELMDEPAVRPEPAAAESGETPEDNAEAEREQEPVTDETTEGEEGRPAAA